jgi:hypothetical protein
MKTNILNGYIHLFSVLIILSFSSFSGFAQNTLNVTGQFTIGKGVAYQLPPNLSCQEVTFANSQILNYKQDGLQGINISNGFPNLQRALRATGLQASDIEIIIIKPDANFSQIGSFLLPLDAVPNIEGSIERRNYLGGEYVININQQKILSGKIDELNVSIDYKVNANCNDDEITAISSYSMPFIVARHSSPKAYRVARAWMQDIGKKGIRFQFQRTTRVLGLKKIRIDEGIIETGNVDLDEAQFEIPKLGELARTTDLEQTSEFKMAVENLVVDPLAHRYKTKDEMIMMYQNQPNTLTVSVENGDYGSIDLAGTSGDVGTVFLQTNDIERHQKIESPMLAYVDNNNRVHWQIFHRMIGARSANILRHTRKIYEKEFAQFQAIHVSIDAANFDADDEEEMVIAIETNNHDVHVLIYDLKQWSGNTPVLQLMAKFQTKGTMPSVAADNLNNNDLEAEVALMVKNENQNGGLLTVYDIEPYRKPKPAPSKVKPISNPQPPQVIPPKKVTPPNKNQPLPYVAHKVGETNELGNSRSLAIDIGQFDDDIEGEIVIISAIFEQVSIYAYDSKFNGMGQMRLTADEILRFDNGLFRHPRIQAVEIATGWKYKRILHDDVFFAKQLNGGATVIDSKTRYGF